MEVLCFFLLIGKLAYDGAKYLYAQWYAENRNPYTIYRRCMANNQTEV